MYNKPGRKPKRKFRILPENFTMPRARRLLTLLFFALTGLPGAHAQSLTATIKVGTGPEGVAVNSVTNKIYVANPGINSATIIDGASNSAITIPIAGSDAPMGFAVNPTTNKIYVANRNDNAVSIIDGATNSTTYVIIAGTFPASVAVNSTTNKIYVSDGGSDNITIIDGATNSTTTLALGGGPGEIAVNSVTNKIYAVTYGATSGYLTVIDGATNATATVAVQGSPGTIALNPVTNEIYLITDGATSGSLTVIDGATNNVTATVPLPGVNPVVLAINTETNKIYVGTVLITSDSDVAVIDGATNSITTVALGYSVAAIVVDPVTNKIFAASATLDGICGLTVIDGLTNSTTNIGTGMCNSSGDVAVNQVTDTIYVTNSEQNSVAVINGAAPTSAPMITVAANGASFASGGIVPGEIATIFGTNLTSSSGINLTSGLPLPTSFLTDAVMVNNQAVPLFAVDSVNGQQQINFQVPWEVANGPNAMIALTNGEISGTSITVPVLAAQPGIFNYIAGGNTFGAILHSNFQTANTGTPAKPGETVLIYCTGLGAVSSPPADGAPGNGQVTANTPTVMIGKINAMVSFSGLAPGFVGLYQINAEVPPGLASGNQPVVVEVMGVSSNSVLLPVQ